jgi:proline dehydrogenase
MSVMRKALLWASTNAWMRERAMTTGFVRRSVKKFMPGETVEDAIVAAKALQPAKINTILTRLGENISHLSEAEDVYNHYMSVLEKVKAAGIDTQISIKPTQLGYDQDPEKCFDYCLRLLKACEAQGVLFWLDMESSPYVEGTLALYMKLRPHSANVGIAIQAYLRRTDADLEALVKIGALVRMVKGAYLEPPDVAFPEKSTVDEQYFKNCARLLQDDARRPGALLHIATHDVALQERLRAVIAERKIDPARYEFAMLYGINSARQHELAKQGVKIRCLISYGEYWFPWYMRRLAERPANVWFVVKNMFKG